MRRAGIHERRALGGSVLLPPGRALASAGAGLPTGVLNAISQPATLGASAANTVHAAMAAAAQAAAYSGTGTVVTAGFSPTDIAGCVLWMDMLDASSYTQAGTVTSINNKKSSVAWTEATAPPDYAATGLNGHPCMDFNGTSHKIISTEAAVFAAGTNAHAYTLFFVAAFNTLDRGDVLFCMGNSGQAANSVRYWGQSTSGTGKWISNTVNDAGTTVAVVGSVASVSTVHAFCWHSPGTTVSLSLDDAAANPSGAAQDPSTLTPNRSSIGCQCRTTPNAFFDGQLGEIILYDSDLSAGDRTTVFNYLSARWA